MTFVWDFVPLFTFWDYILGYFVWWIYVRVDFVPWDFVMGGFVQGSSYQDGLGRQNNTTHIPGVHYPPDSESSSVALITAAGSASLIAAD